MSMWLGLSLGVTRRGGKGSDPVIKQLAHTLYGAGYNSGAAPLTGDGTQKSYAANFVNNSGVAINVASIVHQGWTLRTTGTTDCSANYDVNGTIEYPVGTTVGSFSLTVTPGNNIVSSDITLSSPIAVGGTFRVSETSTPANGATYIQNLGFAGLRCHEKRSLQKKVCLAGFGDSIATNNSGALINAATGKCAAYLNSITGTTAATYGASSAANFVKQADLAAKLGCTHVVTNFGTNDFGASTAVATLQGYLTSMRDVVRAAGVKYAHCTMLPRGKSTNTAVTATLASSGFVITATVPDATKFQSGMAFAISGANEAEYNGTKLCTGVNTGNNTVTFLFIGSAGSAATGTITILPWKPSISAGFWEYYSTFYNSGAGSNRGIFNAWVRSGVFDDYIEWADACEPSRDSGRFLMADESALLPSGMSITVSSVTSTSRFNSNYNKGNSTISGGLVQAITGANAGVLKTGSGNTAGDITLTTAWANTQVVGDTYQTMTGASWFSDDNTHPRVAVGGIGAQPHLDNVTSTWINARL